MPVRLDLLTACGLAGELFHHPLEDRTRAEMVLGSFAEIKGSRLQRRNPASKNSAGNPFIKIPLSKKKPPWIPDKKCRERRMGGWWAMPFKSASCVRKPGCSLYFLRCVLLGRAQFGEGKRTAQLHN